jgi:phosphatidyl-myo-inositol dimannoside synthase
MRVLLTTEARFERTPDGTIWGAAPNSSSAWSRYLDVFSAVLVMARIADAREPAPGLVQASGPGIDFCPLPPHSGAGGLVRSGHAVNAAIKRMSRVCPAVIVRSPSIVAYLIARHMWALNRPYGTQIVGDPDQVFSAGAFQHPLRVPFRCLATAAQKYVARHASVAMFVTSSALQRKYPTLGDVFCGSDVGLEDGSFVDQRPCVGRDKAVFSLVTVAALDQPYKGVAVLLDAVRELRRETPLKLLVVGAGALMPELQARARSLGLQPDVSFVGLVDREGVRQALDAADLFVLPSLTEGLPRALLEAMARRLPAIATNVGGIPELLPADCLVPPKDAGALARRIRELIHDAGALDTLGQRNHRVALGYHERVQAPIRRAFLRAVRDVSAGTAREAICA